ncbi:MAG: SIMPL domain-containing protein [Pseudomonadota bacterium]|nr:SIMPL domain-containing protein [Pseudomonadota bacterium]
MRVPAALGLSLAVAACQQAAPDPRGVARDETLLTVTATGRADSRPDEARLQLGVQSVAATSDEASRLNREKMQKVTEALTALGVKEDQLQTRNLSLQRIDYGPRRGNFSAENIVEVTMRDVSKVGEAVTAVTRAGANVMSGPDLRVSDRETANRSAYASAYRAARSRAEAYAEAADLKIERVLGIYDGGEHGVPTPYPPPPPPVVRQMSAESGAVSAPFSAGTNTTEVRVRVDFALGD